MFSRNRKTSKAKPKRVKKFKSRVVTSDNKKVFHVKKGTMTKHAIAMGFIKSNQRISDIPYHQIDEFALGLASRIGPTTAYRMFQAQIIYRKQEESPFKKKMLKARNVISERYSISTPIKMSEVRNK